MTSTIVLAILQLVSQTTPVGQHSTFRPKGITEASVLYHQYRTEVVAPPFDLPRVEKLCGGLGGEQVKSASVERSDQAFLSLGTPAKFTYCMIYGENFNQNCSGIGLFATPGEETKIFAHPADVFLGLGEWSERQRGFLHSHRREVIDLLRQTITVRNRVGANLKKAILEIDAKEMIPDLVAFYEKSSKDKDILSTLNVLMDRAKYTPYRKSSPFKSASGPFYQAAIPDTARNEKLILDSAVAFAKQRKA